MIFAGAQKFSCGIKDNPLLQMQGLDALLVQSAALSWLMHSPKSALEVVEVIATGWQNSLVNKGVGPVGLITGVESLGIH